MSTTTLILGGGFGGLSAANRLRHLVPDEHKIVVIDESPDFYVGAGKTWLMLGERTLAEISRPRRELLHDGVELVQARVQDIDVDRDTVRTDQGEFAWDHLVIALGAKLNLDAVPGLKEASETFYTVAGARRLNGVLESFAGGRIAIVIPSVPFKCPPAPYEAALLLHDQLERGALTGKAEIAIHTAEGAPMATAGPQMGEFVRRQLSERGIAYHPGRKLAQVDGPAQRLTFEEGTDAAYDLLIAVPPHGVPDPVRVTQLTIHSGWVPVDYLTLKVTSAPSGKDIYAVGDVTAVPLPGRFKPETPLALPKAGVFADAHGQVVAHQIAATILGHEPTETFDGRGYCFLEVGGGKAVKAEGAFFELPHPVMAKHDPSEDQLKDKLAWVARHLGREDRG